VAAAINIHRDVAAAWTVRATVTDDDLNKPGTAAALM